MSATQSRSVDAGDFLILDDGTIMRPISAADSAALVRFHRLLSERSVRLRFFSPHSELSPSEVARFTQVDGEARVALVVECGGELVAVGRYDRLDESAVAEVAFVVADAYQRHGLATMLLHRLASAARSAGVERFVAEVLAENRPMLTVFQNAGFPIETKTEMDTVELMIHIGSDPAGTASDYAGTRQSS
jgi:RimJ/RimL family protein N-acetyltransferase